MVRPNFSLAFALLHVSKNLREAGTVASDSLIRLTEGQAVPVLVLTWSVKQVVDVFVT